MAARTTHPSHGLGQRHVPLGAEAPTAGRPNRRRAHGVASSPDSDLEAFSHNPAHGRADIEGSKSNVAMNAWLPQASYPCDVPPQPNSPPDNVFRPDRPAEAGLGSKKRGIAPLPIHGIIGLESSSTGSSFPADSAKPVPLAVVSLDSRQGHRIPLVRTSSKLAVRRPGKAPEGAVPSPSPGRHAATALAAEAARAVADSRRVRDWDPRAQPSEPILSREKITLPEAPADVSGLPNVAIRTDGRSAQAHAQGFAATAAPSYSSGPGTCPDGRVSAQFGTVNPASGSSRIASSAYQKWPTWSSRFRGTAQRSSRAVLPI
ncbi:hypothetical protein L1887_50114 [Cichorium endivia]|nr:hypothetical protein L1887_50114 [Cichorium endivia]